MRHIPFRFLHNFSAVIKSELHFLMSQAVNLYFLLPRARCILGCTLWAKAADPHILHGISFHLELYYSFLYFRSFSIALDIILFSRFFSLFFTEELVQVSFPAIL